MSVGMEPKLGVGKISGSGRDHKTKEVIKLKEKPKETGSLANVPIPRPIKPKVKPVIPERENLKNLVFNFSKEMSEVVGMIKYPKKMDGQRKLINSIYKQRKDLGWEKTIERIKACKGVSVELKLHAITNMCLRKIKSIKKENKFLPQEFTLMIKSMIDAFKLFEYPESKGVTKSVKNKMKQFNKKYLLGFRQLGKDYFDYKAKERKTIPEREDLKKFIFNFSEEMSKVVDMIEIPEGFSPQRTLINSIYAQRKALGWEETIRQMKSYKPVPETLQLLAVTKMCLRKIKKFKKKNEFPAREFTLVIKSMNDALKLFHILSESKSVNKSVKKKMKQFNKKYLDNFIQLGTKYFDDKAKQRIKIEQKTVVKPRKITKEIKSVDRKVIRDTVLGRTKTKRAPKTNLRESAPESQLDQNQVIEDLRESVNDRKSKKTDQAPKTETIIIAPEVPLDQIRVIENQDKPKKVSKKKKSIIEKMFDKKRTDVQLPEVKLERLDWSKEKYSVDLNVSPKEKPDVVIEGLDNIEKLFTIEKLNTDLMLVRAKYANYRVGRGQEEYEDFLTKLLDVDKRMKELNKDARFKDDKQVQSWLKKIFKEINILKAFFSRERRSRTGLVKLVKDSKLKSYYFVKVSEENEDNSIDKPTSKLIKKFNTKGSELFNACQTLSANPTRENVFKMVVIRKDFIKLQRKLLDPKVKLPPDEQNIIASNSISLKILDKFCEKYLEYFKIFLMEEIKHPFNRMPIKEDVFKLQKVKYTERDQKTGKELEKTKIQFVKTEQSEMIGEDLGDNYKNSEEFSRNTLNYLDTANDKKKICFNILKKECKSLKYFSKAKTIIVNTINLGQKFSKLNEINNDKAVSGEVLREIVEMRPGKLWNDMDKIQDLLEEGQKIDLRKYMNQKKGRMIFYRENDPRVEEGIRKFIISLIDALPDPYDEEDFCRALNKVAQQYALNAIFDFSEFMLGTTNNYLDILSEAEEVRISWNKLPKAKEKKNKAKKKETNYKQQIIDGFMNFLENEKAPLMRHPLTRGNEYFIYKDYPSLEVLIASYTRNPGQKNMTVNALARHSDWYFVKKLQEFNTLVSKVNIF
ncbi:hypothetical protein ACFLZV_01410 [Candidatus Margulisiibacteriota bacterium]